MRVHGLVACALMFGCGGSPKPAASPPPIPEGPKPEPAVSQQPAPMPAPDTAAPKSLYDRLGGKDAITAVIDEFVARTTTDPRVKERFFNVDAVQLKKNLVDFVCVATGGPCKYEGRDMSTAHAGMDLVDDEFNAVVEDLVGALDKFKVPEKEKNEILGALGPLKPQMVVSADKLKPIDQAKLDAATKLAATLKDPKAKELLDDAILAGKRGQRNYAEMLFTRAEMATGPKAVASIASTFRAGAPPRVTTALKTMPKDTAPQPKEVGSSDVDEPAKKPEAGQLSGVLKVDGKVGGGMGVVMLWPEKGGKKRTPKTRVIEQRGKTFEPHVMAVPVGSTVSFPNFDSVYHNVFSLSKSKAFDLGMYKNGETRDVKFDKPGIIRLGCNLHANMSAYLIVVDAPHYAVVGDDGSFKFASLAPGKYKVQAWSERSADPLTQEITIKAGANDQPLELKAGGSAIGPDKFGQSRN